MEKSLDVFLLGYLKAKSMLSVRTASSSVCSSAVRLAAQVW